MIFTSPHAGFCVHIKDPTYLTDTNGFREQDRPSLIADFMDPSVSTSGINADGIAWNDVRGGCFDTDEAAERLNWTDEEKGYAESALLSMARNPRQPITLWEPPALEAPIPNWDNLSANRVLAIASELDVVHEALAYERQTQNREELVAMLEKKIATLKEEETLTAA